MTRDALTDRTQAGTCWTRSNISEVVPGVLTPLGWSFYGHLMDVASRRGFYQLGVLPRSAVAYPEEPDRRILGVFHGRPALNVSTMRAMMSGLPGVSGDDFERDVIGTVRSGVVDDSYGWRVPAVVAKAGIALYRSGSMAAAVHAETRAWWSARFDPTGIADGTAPREALQEAVRHFGDAVVAQSRNRMLYQAASSRIVALAEQSGNPQSSGALLACGGDLEESAVAADLLSLADGRMGLDMFVARHGFHGPDAGDLTSRSWRENPAPIEKLVRTLQSTVPPRRRDDTAHSDAVRTVLQALPARHRLGARAALRLGPPAATSLERSKVAMTMALDGARAAARALGAQLVADGVLERAEDAFFLFHHELLGPAGSDLRDRVAQRRAHHERHIGIELVRNTWEGDPELRELRAADRSCVTEVTGVGGSPGVVEGRVTVVLDGGADTDIDAGDILVCPVTDPSWVCLMMVAGGLVIDIGSTSSHGAIVARELGVPCVIGTSTGTIDLRTGDMVRVDGSRGLVTVLKRADS